MVKKIQWNTTPSGPKKVTKKVKNQKSVPGTLTVAPGVAKPVVHKKKAVLVPDASVSRKPITTPKLDNEFSLKSQLKALPKYIKCNEFSEKITPGMYRTEYPLVLNPSVGHEFPFYGENRYGSVADQIPENTLLFFIKTINTKELLNNRDDNNFRSKAQLQIIERKRSLFLFNGKPVIIGDTAALNKV